MNEHSDGVPSLVFHLKYLFVIQHLSEVGKHPSPSYLSLTDAQTSHNVSLDYALNHLSELRSPTLTDSPSPSHHALFNSLAVRVILPCQTFL